MGFLDRLTRGGEDGRDATQADRDASIAAVEAGGLPLNAQRRLRALAADDGALFTSDLSVNGFVLSHGLLLEPVCQVMGSSVYKMGWRSQGWSTGELRTQTAALNNARALALGRMRQEAELAEAHAVVGVTIRRGAHDFVDDGVEFIAVGTAVRAPGPQAAAAPVLTDLSLADYAQLAAGGYEPVGVVAASTVYYIVASWNTRRAQGAWFGGWGNQELGDFTQGVYAARESALSNLQQQAQGLACEGVVGVSIEKHIRMHEVGSENNKRKDLIVTFHVIGTAIRPAGPGGGSGVAPRPVISQAAS